MKPKYSLLLRNRLTLAALVPILSQPLCAASIFWANTGTDFNAGASWLGGTAPGSADIATFAGAKSTDPVLSAPASIRGLTFSNAAASSYSISGSTLTLGSGGIDASDVTSGTNTITSALTLAAGGGTWSAGTGSILAVNPTTFTRSSGSAVTIDKTLGGGTLSTTLANTNGILGAWASVRSSGTSANNSADGDTYATVSGGSIVPYTGATSFTGIAGVFGGIPSGGTGTANYDVNGTGTFSAFGLNRNINTIRYSGGGATQPSNISPVGNVLTINGIMNSGTGVLFIGGTGGANNEGINTTVGSLNDLVLAPMSAGITIRNGILNGSGGNSSVTVVGNETVTVSGNTSNYTGPTTVAGGTLLISGTGTINTTSGITINGANAKYLHTGSVASTRPITLNNGTLDGTGTVGAVSVANNAGSIVTNGNGGTTPLTLGSLNFNGAATVNANYGASAPIVVTGALATTPANGQVMLNVPGAAPNGLINLISFGSFGGSPADFTLSMPGLGSRQSAGALQLNGSNIAVNVTAEIIVWTGDNDDLWDTAANGDNSGPNNWATKTAHTATNFWLNDSVEFNDTYNLGAGDVAVSDGYVWTDTGVSPVSTTFNNSAVPYVIDSVEDGIKTGTLTKNGSETTTLIGTHTYTGATTINAGTLQLGDGSYDGTIANTASVTNNGTLAYNWFTNRTAAYPISGSGSLVKEGTATLTLTGANTSTGGTTVTEGAITVNGGGNLGSGAVAVSPGASINFEKTLTLPQTFTGGGTITNNAGTVTISGDFSGFTGTFKHASATSSTVLTSTTATSANTAYEITIGNATSQGILPNVTTGDNTFALGSLSGVVNSVFRNGAAVTGTTTLEIGNLDTDTDFAGTFGGGGGTLALTKVGAGTLTLSGPCTYNGATAINAGTLRFTSSAKTLAASGFTVADGAELEVQSPAADATPLTNASLTLGSSNLAFDFNNLNPTVPQISTGALTVNGATTLSFLNANVLANGTYKLVDYTSISGSGSFPGGSIAVGNRGSATIVNNAIDTSIDLVLSTDVPKWTGLDNGEWVVGSTGSNKNWKLVTAGTATDYIDDDTVLFDDSAAGTTDITIPVDVVPLSTTFDNSSKTYTVSGTGGIASGPLTKNGTGTTTLLTTNLYNGPTTINAGTLQLGNGTVDGSIANTASVTNNGTIAFYRTADHTAAYPISGTGNLTKSGTGNLTLSGNNLYSGGTSVTAGVVTLAGNGTLGSGAISLGSDTTLTINKNLPIPNTVTGPGAIINTGTTTVTGDFSGYSGTFTHDSTVVSVAFNTASATSENAAYHIASEQGGSQGMLAAGNGDYTLKLGALSGVANSLFRGGNTVSGTTTLEIGNLGTSTEFGGSINNGVSKTIAVTKTGAGTLTLSGASGYTGATNVNGGTLNVTGSISGAGLVTVNPSGTLAGTGSVAGTIIASGTVAPGTSAGVLTTGPATITGTLAIEIDGAAGDKLTSTGTINLGGTTLTVTELTGGFTQPSYVIAEGTSITGSFASVPSGYAVNIVSGGPGQQAVLTSTAGGGYASWASANAGSQTAGQDYNNDGVDNGIAYFMNDAGMISLPGVIGGAVTWTNGGNIPASAYDTQFVVQTSSNLTSWTDVPVGSLTTNTDGPGGSLTYTLPTGAGKVFVRLSVTPN